MDFIAIVQFSLGLACGSGIATAAFILFVE